MVPLDVRQCVVKQSEMSEAEWTIRYDTTEEFIWTKKLSVVSLIY